MFQKNQSNSNDSVAFGISIEDSKKLLDAQEQHGQLFLFTLNNIKVVYRPLKVSELDTIQKLISICNQDGVDEWIVDKCVVFSSVDLYDALAGVINAVSKKIITSSSLTEVQYKELIALHRSKVETLESMVTTTILKVHPTIDPRKLDMFTRVKLQAVAEHALNTKIMFGDEANQAPKAKKGFTSLGGQAKADILSKEAADKPDFAKDNAQLNGV